MLIVQTCSPIIIIALSLIIIILSFCMIRQYRLILQFRNKDTGIKEIINDQVFDLLPMSFIIFSSKGKVLRANKTLLDELELTHEKITNCNITEIIEIVHNKKNKFPQFIEMITCKNRALHFGANTFIREPQKNIRFLIEGTLVGIYKKDKLNQYILFYRNILEERTQKYILNIALSKTSIFPWHYDMDRDTMVIDPRYFEYLKLPTKDYTLTLKEFENLVHPDDRKNVFDALGKQTSGDLYEAPVAFRIHRGDGNWEWFEAQSTYVGQLSDLPFRIIGICMSIQRHKDIENILNEAVKKARRSDELKSAFLANMSHEIRTPLNAVVGFSSLLSSEINELKDKEKEEYAKLIEKNSNLLLMLISDILDLSKIESNTMEFRFSDVSLKSFFQDIAAIHNINIKKDVTLEILLPSENMTITTDPDRLGQVINNLINNAKKFTEKGYIRFGYKLKNENFIDLFVEDTGCGMSQQVMSHIFERFYKADSFAQGTGLGLVICQTIIQRLQGKIEVTSEKDKGSLFTVTLPTNHNISLKNKTISYISSN